MILAYSDFTFVNLNFDLRKRSGFKEKLQLLNVCFVFKQIILMMHVFESTYSTIISNIQKSLGKGSVRIIDSVIDHNIIISKYNSLHFSL